MLAGIVLLIAAFIYGYWQVLTRPARKLERRAPLGAPRSGKEARKAALAKLTYSQLGVALLALTVMLLKVSHRSDLLVGWNRLWLVGAALGALAIAYRAYRKWKFDSSNS